jgi:TRAP-type mannitol/chloroaromatic compound transport system permease large subunit
VGGLIAARERQHLTLSTAEAIGHARVRGAARVFSSAVAAAVCAVLAVSAYGVVVADREAGAVLSIGLPVWISECIMPVTLSLLSLRLAWMASNDWRGRAIAFLGIAGALALGLVPQWSGGLALPLVAVILLAALVGAPVFVAMGGIALVLFFKDSVPVSAVTADIYRLMVSPTLPAVPLLTACGYVMAESQASHRLVRFFRALFGWMPGGVAVLVAAVCALFTTFTGGSGVTIMALGGLLLPVLLKDGYPEGFSLGLVTASGSLGLLLPPSLPVILYAVVANVPADQLYLAGLLPGLLLILIVAGYGMHVGRKVEGEAAVLVARGDRVRLGGALGAVGACDRRRSLHHRAHHHGRGRGGGVRLRHLRRVLHHAGHPSVQDAPRRAREGRRAVRFGAHPARLGARAHQLARRCADPDLLLHTVQAHIHSQHVFLLVLNLVLLVLGSVLRSTRPSSSWRRSWRRSARPSGWTRSTSAWCSSPTSSSASCSRRLDRTCSCRRRASVSHCPSSTAMSCRSCSSSARARWR